MIVYGGKNGDSYSVLGDESLTAINSNSAEFTNGGHPVAGYYSGGYYQLGKTYIFVTTASSAVTTGVRDGEKYIYIEKAVKGNATSGQYVLMLTNESYSTLNRYYYIYSFENNPSKGTLSGYVTSTSSGYYPTDGASGSYWYTRR